jgi:MoxR-like ATPase
VVDVAVEVMRHRVVLSYEALADGVSVDDLLATILTRVPAPRLAPSQDATASAPPPPPPMAAVGS